MKPPLYPPSHRGGRVSPWSREGMRHSRIASGSPTALTEGAVQSTAFVGLAPASAWARELSKGATPVCPLDVQKLTVPPATLSPQVRDSYPAAVE